MELLIMQFFTHPCLLKLLAFLVSGKGTIVTDVPICARNTRLTQLKTLNNYIGAYLLCILGMAYILQTIDVT